MGKDIKVIIGENIRELRQINKMTQFELADQLSYSDKAVSKWERGESTPDPEAMLKLSEIFKVKIDYFYHEDNKEQYLGKDNIANTRNVLLTILFCIAIITVCTSVFLIAYFTDNESINRYWISFLYAVPLSCLVVYRYFMTIKSRVGKLVTASLFLWSTLSLAFLQMYVYNVKAGMIFIIGIPLQAALIVYSYVRK